MNSEREAILRLAREAVENYVQGKGKIEIPDWVPESLLNQRAAVFVSLKKDHRLRGCIGTLEPTRPSVAQEIIDMAVEASTRDPRFPRVGPKELEELDYSVDLLSAPEEVGSIEDLDAQRYGVIVSKGWRRGVLLPRLEGIDTAVQQVAIALRKAGIEPDEAYELERFEVRRYVLEEDEEA